MSDTAGIHHVAATAGDPQPDVDFYTGVLGPRFLKRTVNHEDRFAYHLYCGDGAGRTLELPPRFEEDRGTIEPQLPPLSMPDSTTG